MGHYSWLAPTSAAALHWDGTGCGRWWFSRAAWWSSLDICSKKEKKWNAWRVLFLVLCFRFWQLLTVIKFQSQKFSRNIQTWWEVTAKKTTFIFFSPAFGKVIFYFFILFFLIFYKWSLFSSVFLLIIVILMRQYINLDVSFWGKRWPPPDVTVDFFLKKV